MAHDFSSLDPHEISEKASRQEAARKEGFKDLQREVERLRLVVETLVRALVEKGLYTREQINALANLIDMEDGRRDGRIPISRKVKNCSACGKVMMNVSGACVYCGHQEVMDIV